MSGFILVVICHLSLKGDDVTSDHQGRRAVDEGGNWWFAPLHMAE